MADRETTVPRKGCADDVTVRGRPGPDQTSGTQAGDRPRPGDDLPKVSGEKSTHALRLGGGSGGRPGALAPRRPYSGTADQCRRKGAQMDETAPGGGWIGHSRRSCDGLWLRPGDLAMAASSLRARR